MQLILKAVPGCNDAHATTLELLKPIDLHKTKVFVVHFLGGREESTEEHLRSCTQSKTTETRDGEKHHRQR